MHFCTDLSAEVVNEAIHFLPKYILHLFIIHCLGCVRRIAKKHPDSKHACDMQVLILVISHEHLDSTAAQVADWVFQILFFSC